MTTIETDYLVVGAGATGMAFTDALVEHGDCDVVLVDRHHGPGGHWNDDYPFVRLHQPSAMYGVASRVLGADRIDAVGINTGFYERATAAELCDYYGRVLDEQMLPSGRVRFLGVSDYVGPSADVADVSEGDDHEVRSRVTGATTTVRVRRCLVDATYMESSLPSTHTPPFDIDQGARVVAPNDLVDLDGAAAGFTVVGAGKTSMDTCSWLLDHGVDPGSIRWIRPRDAWTNDRADVQPLALVDSLVRWITRQNEAAAAATDIDDLFPALEARDVLHRLDPDVEPGFFRGAILCEPERSALQQITDVVRLGKVRSIGRHEIVLDQGSTPSDPAHVHVDCTAAGLGSRPNRPIFAPRRITPQIIQGGIVPFSAALIGFVEAIKTDDDEKNSLCPPNRFTPEADAESFARIWLTTQRAFGAWMSDPDVASWLATCRLSVLGNAGEFLARPETALAFEELLATAGPAVANLERILGE